MTPSRENHINRGRKMGQKYSIAKLARSILIPISDHHGHALNSQISKSYQAGNRKKAQKISLSLRSLDLDLSPVRNPGYATGNAVTGRQVGNDRICETAGECERK